jgi:hypothetical protein
MENLGDSVKELEFAELGKNRGSRDNINWQSFFRFFSKLIDVLLGGKHMLSVVNLFKLAAVYGVPA